MLHREKGGILIQYLVRNPPQRSYTVWRKSAVQKPIQQQHVRKYTNSAREIYRSTAVVSFI